MDRWSRALVAALASGSVLLMLAEDLDLGDSVYLAVMAASSVGFGDITPRTPMGRIVVFVISVVGVSAWVRVQQQFSAGHGRLCAAACAMAACLLVVLARWEGKDPSEALWLLSQLTTGTGFGDVPMTTPQGRLGVALFVGVGHQACVWLVGGVDRYLEIADRAALRYFGLRASNDLSATKNFDV
mmetsp:Transcript_119372/g.337714  ORF Transcript_119372/g.337714 Transcript_119372/m.337714 type:complete len:185 (+) Transcript_119372:165-719(+)